MESIRTPDNNNFSRDSVCGGPIGLCQRATDNDNLNDYAEYVNDNTPPYSVQYSTSSPPPHNEYHQHNDPGRDDYYSDDRPHHHNEQGAAVYDDDNSIRLDHNYYLDRVGDDGVDQWEGYRSELEE